ncbi:Uu.00g043880.m01.CDS01 [Anthostomella pinea]|uniref:Uu.00g043880.m01.CDS01 n=1 Tax=Anthostomella pinea TaxID=933095 RepID=A0AAI8VBT3_9PEZI|nr:Uu.00g043880.m01.CDS01 [Anthostomella pinea]
MSTESDNTAPSLEVALEISPSTYQQHDWEGVPALSIRATLDPSVAGPITVMTFGTIFNPRLALQRRNFFAQEITSDPPRTVNFEMTKGPKRSALQRKKGSSDERHYITFHPGQEMIVKQPFSIVRRSKTEVQVAGSEVGDRSFRVGHTYRFGVSEEGKEMKTWWWGTKDDGLDEPEGPCKDVANVQGEGLVRITAHTAEFTIAE